MKPHMPHVPLNNPYHRNPGNFYQPHQAVPYARPSLPMYSTTVTNAPIAMMNYFNAPANQQALNFEQENAYANQFQQQQQQQHPKKQLSIDLVSSLNLVLSSNFMIKSLSDCQFFCCRNYHKLNCQA